MTRIGGREAQLERSEKVELRRKALVLTAAFWLFFYALTVLAVLYFRDQPLDMTVTAMLLPRLGGNLVGFLLCCAIYFVLEQLQRWSFAVQVAVVAALGVPAGIIYLDVERHVLLALSAGFDAEMPEIPRFLYAQRVLFWLYFFMSWATAILALCHATAKIREQRMRTEAQQLAYQAQMRALRYQLNPHFLFNTLNSIVALVSRRQSKTAAAMIENLSDFLRTALALDPEEDIPLHREAEIQRLYLDIELLRFPERLDVSIAIPDALRMALVPSLITQPLVENAIKYAVARSSSPVRLEIKAGESRGRLVVSIADDGGNAPPVTGGGTNIGLRNVTNRLRARFGDNFEFRAGPRPAGGFEASFAIPLSLRD